MPHDTDCWGRNHRHGQPTLLQRLFRRPPKPEWTPEEVDKIVERIVLDLRGPLGGRKPE